VNGIDYHFLSQEDFDSRVAAGEFVEHAVYAGNSYGTLRSELDRPAQAVILEIDLQGARQVRDTLPGATRIFIEPPSFDVLRERLTARASDSPEEIDRRLAAAEEELEAATEFHHRVVNDDRERAARDLARLVASMSKS
jgi:guanylate kinase